MDEYNREEYLNGEGRRFDGGNGDDAANTNANMETSASTNTDTSTNTNNYVFWAEEAATAEKQATNHQAEASSVNYQATNPEGAKYEAPNYESNFNQGARGYGSDYAATGSGGHKKEKKSGGFGRKASKFVACAVAFGLIAGLTFQGVNRTAEVLFPSKTAAIETVKTTVPTTSTNISGTTSSTDLTKLVKNTMPSIVSITSTMSQDYSYFGQVYSEEYDGSASGIIVGQNDSEIFIVTNNHVVGGAKAIAVNFINDKVYEAKVKGTDTTADLAVVAVETADMDEDTLNSIKIATLGNSDEVEVGQMAVAIGNALGSGQSVTVGYISAKNRQINTTSNSQGSQLELLQTDAAINPGNSGGALLNVKGEVIGINDMKYADTDVEGMGYAIPISEATPIINELMNRETLSDNEKGYLGISGTDITEDNNVYNMPIGVYVNEVAAGGAAEEGGLQKGDIITKINGATAKTIAAVQEKVNNTRAGTQITVTVMRNSNGEYTEMELKITLKDASTLDKLNGSSGKAAQGNFGYKSNDNDTNNNPQGNGQQAPNQNGSGNQSDQSINDQLQDFFNQFYN